VELGRVGSGAAMAMDALAEFAPLLTLQNVVQGLCVAVFVAVVIMKLRAPKLKLPPGPVALPVVGNWLQVCGATLWIFFE
jgi:hypothetical protein